MKKLINIFILIFIMMPIMFSINGYNATNNEYESEMVQYDANSDFPIIKSVKLDAKQMHYIEDNPDSDDEFDYHKMVLRAEVETEPTRYTNGNPIVNLDSSINFESTNDTTELFVGEMDYIGRSGSSDEEHTWYYSKVIDERDSFISDDSYEIHYTINAKFLGDPNPDNTKLEMVL